MQGDRVGEVIERAPQGMNAIAGDDGPAFERWGIAYVDGYAMAGSSAVMPAPRLIRPSRVPSQHLIFQGIQMLVRAGDLSPATCKLFPG